MALISLSSTELETEEECKWTSVPRTFWFVRSPCRLLTYLFQFLRKFFPWARLAIPVRTPTGKASLAQSPDRPVRRPKKRLGTVAHVILAFAPLRFQRAFGYLTIMERDLVPKETLDAPVHPSGKGNKRKKDDVTLEEELCWAELLQKELPDEDDPEDPTYEFTVSETDSEEYKSQNDTDVNLEVEEKDGFLMLKEDPAQQEDPKKEIGAGEEALDPRCSGDGSEQPDEEVPDDGGDNPGANPTSPAPPESTLLLPSRNPSAEMTSSDNSQDQWVNVSGE
ncbi:uncharacterized protein LOC114588641 [Podarcis muralis]